MTKHGLQIALAIGTCTVLLSGLAFAFVSYQQAESSSSVSEWPAFEMTYEDWGINRATNGSKENGGYARAQVNYTNRYNYHFEILEDTSVPATVGTTVEMSPDAYVNYNAWTGRTSTVPIAPGESYRVDDWLAPGLVSSWISKYDAVVKPTETEGVNQMSYSEQVPCDKSIFTCEKDYFSIETQVKFWAEHDVPMEIIKIRDGVLQRKITVTDFRWLGTPP